MTNTIVTKKTLQDSPNGCDCTFVKIGDAGMKIYTDDHERDKQFRLQGLFHKVGLAPQCWFMFDFEGPDKNTLYAYYSELAEVRTTTEYDTADYHEFNEISDNLATEIKDKYGIFWTDNHSKNVGRLNGKPVIIDFGYMTGLEVLESA